MDLKQVLAGLRAAQGGHRGVRAGAIRDALPMAAQEDNAGQVVRDYLSDTLKVNLRAEEARRLRGIIREGVGAHACAWRAAMLRAQDGGSVPWYDALEAVWGYAEPLGSLEARRAEVRRVAQFCQDWRYYLVGIGVHMEVRSTGGWTASYLSWGQTPATSVRLAVRERTADVDFGRSIRAALENIEQGPALGVMHPILTQGVEVSTYGWVSAYLSQHHDPASNTLARLMRGGANP